MNAPAAAHLHLQALVSIAGGRLGTIPELPAVVAPARLSEGPLPKVGAAYTTLRREYRAIIEAAVAGYLESSGGVRRWRNIASRAVLDYFAKAFYRGLRDVGAEETDDEDENWLTARMNAELSYVNAMFAGLKVKRTAGAEAAAEASARADGYAATLDGVYSEGKLRGAKGKVLEFGGPSGNESCQTCMKLIGKRMRVSTILKRGLVPKPGNEKFECGCWQCEHYWFDPKTKERYTF